MRVALDTNILVYAEGVNGAAKKKLAIELVQQLPPASVVLPVQVLGELFQVLVRKAGRSSAKARSAILGWQDAFGVEETSVGVILAAADLATDHHFNFWDAVIFSAAAEAGCRLLLSEDLHDGFTWSGVTISNPFASAANPLLQALLSSKAEE